MFSNVRFSFKKEYFVIASLIIIGLWLLLPLGIHTDTSEALYSKQEYQQDLCDIYTSIGQMAFTRRDYAKAVESFKQALENAPSRHDLYEKLRLACKKAGIAVKDIFSDFDKNTNPA